MSEQLAKADDHEYVWRLIDHHAFDAVIATCPPDFNMASLHPEDGCTLLQSIVERCVCAENSEVKQCLDLAKWLIERGADPRTKAPETCEGEFCLDLDDGDETWSCEFADESAIGTLLEIRTKMQSENTDKELTGDASWDRDIAALDKLLDIFTKTVPAGADWFQRVDSGVVDTWDKMRHDKGRHDVVFETSTQHATAHSCVLSTASPVLAVMLTSGFQEGASKHIDIKDTPVTAVSLLLDLAYTGATSSALDDVTIVLSALDLAHRWQMQSVVDMLERALKNMLADETFSIIAEVATLKGLQALKNSCIAFARTSKKVQQDLAKNQVPQTVLALMGRYAPPAKKRRKFL